MGFDAVADVQNRFLLEPLLVRVGDCSDGGIEFRVVGMSDLDDESVLMVDDARLIAPLSPRAPP